jgi:outer membrane protein
MRKLFLLTMSCFCLIMAVFSLSAFGEEYTLDDLYRLALKQAEKIKVSEENINNARLEIDRARGALIPNLSAYGTYTQYSESHLDDAGKVIQQNQAGTWGLQLTQSYSLGGREFNSLDIAGKNLEKSGYDLVALKQDYLLSTSAGFYDLLKAKKALEIANANLERLTKYRDAANTRLRVGEATKTALLRAQGELSGALSDKTKSMNSIEAAKFSLARIVGIEGPFDVKETIEVDVASGSLAELEKQALNSRAELKSLEMQKKIAEKQVDSAKSSNWPSLSLGAAYARIDESPLKSSSLNRDSIYGSVGLTFTLFDGGERKADVMQAETKLRQAELLYRDAVKSVMLEVENAYLDYTTQQGIIKFLQDQLAYAQDNFNAVSKQYEYGLANSLDVIDANNLLLSAQRQLSDALYNSRFSLLKLKKVTMGSLDVTGDGKK